MAKQIRSIVASEDVAALIDQGSQVDTDLKNLTFKDKGFKSQITKHVDGLLEDGELSVKLEGNTAKALVTASQKFGFAVGQSEHDDEILEAAENGILNGAVKVSKSICLPPADLERAVELLKEAGIAATLKKSYAIDTKAYREFSDEGSPESAAVKELLDQCVTKTTSFRVKYER